MVGTALHAALQYLRYESCGSLPEVEEELDRLVNAGYLSEEQRGMVSGEKITAFFQSEIGRKLRNGTPYLREFKFSILDNGRFYADGLEEEQVLLQGVVDCALIEEDGITILDFKTDYVTEDTLEDKAQYYQTQIASYAQAMSRIYEMPVKAKYLYFFRMNRLVEI